MLDRGYANFSELRLAELRRITLPRTSVNRARRRAGALGAPTPVALGDPVLRNAPLDGDHRPGRRELRRLQRRRPHGRRRYRLPQRDLLGRLEGVGDVARPIRRDGPGEEERFALVRALGVFEDLDGVSFA